MREVICLDIEYAGLAAMPTSGRSLRCGTRPMNPASSHAHSPNAFLAAARMALLQCPAHRRPEAPEPITFVASIAANARSVARQFATTS